MFGILRRHVIRQRFKKMVADFDRRIEEARELHQPVKHLLEAKREYVRQRLEGAVAGARR